MANGSHDDLQPAEPAPAPRASEAIEAELQRVLSSQTFSKAPTLRTLLDYLASPSSASASEYAIATEALGRRADFDPKIDATVRVQISRLRTKLKQFYDGEGADHAVRLALPMGEHRIVAQPVARQVESTARADDAPFGSAQGRPFDSAQGKAAPPVPESVDPRLGVRPRSWRGIAVALALGLVAVAAWSLAGWRPTLGSAAARSDPPRFWRAFFEDGRPARLIVPTPVFLHWPKRTVRIRDFRINEFGDARKSPDLLALINRYGEPKLSESYSVASDTIAAIRLTQHLTKLGYPLTTGATPDLPLEAFGDDHIIFLGIPATTSHVHETLKRTNFWMEPSATTVHNRQPRRGEQPTYAPVDLSERRGRQFGIVALLPARNGQSKLLVLAGGNTAALSSCLIAPRSLAMLDRLWDRHGRPAFFEALVQADVQGDTLLRAEPVAFRSFPSPPKRAISARNTP